MEQFSKQEQLLIEQLKRMHRADFDSHVLGDLKARIFSGVAFGEEPRRVFLPRLVLAPAFAAIAVMMFAVGAGFAGQKSMPGDALYPLKSKVEAARVALAPGSAKKAELQAQFSYERIRELKLISERTADPAELKDAIRRYESNLKEVKRAAKDVSDSAAIAAIAGSLQENVEALLAAAEKGLADSDDRMSGVSQRFVDSAQVSVAVLSEVVERLATSSSELDASGKSE